jgi:hypothetical protein
MLFAADKGDINTIIGGIAPDWGPFGSLGNEAKVMIEVVMAVAILLCLGIAIWGAAKQRIGATALRDTFSAEQGKGLIIAGLTGVFIIGSLGTLFTIVYGMAAPADSGTARVEPPQSPESQMPRIVGGVRANECRAMFETWLKRPDNNPRQGEFVKQLLAATRD